MKVHRQALAKDGSKLPVNQLPLLPLDLAEDRLPTNGTANRHPIHRWFNFIAGFSPEFVAKCIREAELRATDLVVDPFAGMCTTLVQANFEGVPSVGFEPHPFFHQISLAKIAPPLSGRQIDAVQTVCESVTPYPGQLAHVWAADALKFLTKLVPESELQLLASALIAEPKVESDLRPLFRLVVSRVLEASATSQTDGIYKAPTSKKTSMPYLRALRGVFKEIREDQALLEGRPVARATLHKSSSELMNPLEDASASLCVTSPPYLNNFDYAEMTRMELYFWKYADCWRDITEKVRRQLVVNTTTAPTDLKRDQARFEQLLAPEIRTRLQPLVDSLAREREHKAGKKDYNLLVYPYFAQMQTVIKELRRVLRPGRSLHMVVGDAALYGVHVKTNELLACLMEYNGFEILDMVKLRTRGDRWILDKRQGTLGNLGEFHIHARRLKI